MAAWVAPVVMSAISGGLDMFSAGQRRGAAQKAGRDANQARVESGKKKVRAAWKMILEEWEISKETIDILERNTAKQIELYEAEQFRDWAAEEDLRFDDFRREAAAYNQSVEDLTTNLNFNDISANMAYQEEKNFMEDFHTSQRFEALDDAISKQELIADKRASNLQLRADRLEFRQALTSDITERIGLRRQQEAFRAEQAFENQQDIIKGLQTIGNLKATGMAGRSARKAVQAASFDVGSRQAMRADALLNANSVFKNEMAKLSNRRYYSAKQYDVARKSHDITAARLDLKHQRLDLNTSKRAASLQSMLKANALRKDRIAASKYSADLQARRNVLSQPELRKPTPIPFEAFRPEFQRPERPSQTKFYDMHMPHLEDENKIYGDRGAGAPSNLGMDILGIGMNMATAAAGAGAFGGGGGDGTTYGVRRSVTPTTTVRATPGMT